MLKNVIEAERDQDADCTRIDAAVRLAEQDIAALESRQLDPDQTYKKWSEIRDRTILAVRDVRRNIVKRANEAKEIQRAMIETSFRERAAYPSNDNAQPLLEYSALSCRTSQRRDFSIISATGSRSPTLFAFKPFV